MTALDDGVELEQASPAPEPEHLPKSPRLRSVWSDVSGTGRALGIAASGRLVRVRTWLSWITTLGFVFLAVGVVGWIVGLRLGWRELLVIAGAALVALACALLFTIGRLTATIDLDANPRRVVVGDGASAAITVTNPSAKRILPFDVDLVVGSGRAVFAIPSLGAGASHDELMSIPTHRRAVITLGPATTVRSDPVGLVMRSAAWSTSFDVFVHPETVALESLGAGLLRDLEGRATNDVSPSDVEIHALRDYVPGDDRRHVHWRTSARTGKLMVRQFIDTRRSHLGLVVPARITEFADEVEYELAVSVLASLGVRAVIDSIELTVVGGDDNLPTTSAQLLLDRVSGVTATTGGATLVDSTRTLNRVADGLTLALVIGGSATSRDAWSAAAAQFDPDVRRILVVCDLAAPSGFASYAGASRISVQRLADLPRLLAAATS